MNRNWTTKVLCFVLGIVATCLATAIVPAWSVPAQDLQQQIDSLKTRVYNLEQYNVAVEAAKEAARKEEDQRSKGTHHEGYERHLP
jgi:outer membrane murein-binding lipoprotein Lpp